MRLAAAAVLLAVLFPACGGRENAPAPHPSEIPPVTAVPVLKVIELRLGRGPERAPVSDRQTVFAPQDPVALTVITQGSRASARLRVRLSIAAKPLAESSTAFAPTGTTVTDFALSRPEGWPLGTGRVEVWLEEEPAGAVDFEVRAAVR